jgi:hypothetical protein
MIADAHGMKAPGGHRPERFVVARSTRHSCGKESRFWHRSSNAKKPAGDF